MNDSQIAELQKAIELAQDGQWMPATIVAGFLGLIIVLLLYIYRKDQSISNKRHEDSEVQIKLLTKIVDKLEVNDENKDREIKSIKDDVKENRQDIKRILT